MNVASRERVPDHGALTRFLRAAGAEDLRYGARGRTLLDHLTGTRDVLRRWNQPEPLQRAALVHRVYGARQDRRRLFTSADRDRVRDAAGPDAERLSSLFSTIAPDEITAQLDAQDADALLLVHMASLAAGAEAPDGSPAPWLAHAARLAARLATGRSAPAPPLVDPHLVGLTSADEDEARRSYLLGVGECTGTGGDAERRLAQAALLCRVVAEPCVWLAYRALRSADLGAGRWWLEQARQRLEALGTAWDKRLSYDAWHDVIERMDGICRAGRRLDVPVAGGHPRDLVSALAEATDHDDETDHADETDAQGPAESGRARFGRYLDSFATPSPDTRRQYYPGLPGRPFHDRADVGLAGYLEAHFPAIRDEILALDGAAYHPEAEAIERTGNWDVLFFFDRGVRVAENCDACPVLLEGLERHATIRTISGLIYASRLRPGTHIAPHRGPTTMRLRCHLGIQVPEGDCGIRVGEEARSWQEGRCLVLDDSFEHEAWNHAERDRIVLVVDVWHPGLTATEIRLLEGLQDYAYQYAERQYRYWTTAGGRPRSDGPS